MCGLNKLIRLVSKYLCQISAAFNCTAIPSVWLFPLPWWPPWRKPDQTGYELMAEYGFRVNFWCFHQHWPQSEVFCRKDGDKHNRLDPSCPSAL